MSQTRFSKIAAAVLALAALAVAGAAQATSVSFGDTTRYWAGYGNGTADDGRDTIGTPDLLGGTVEFQGGLITQVKIDYRGLISLAGSGSGRVIPGDLFIDAGSNGTWDFVLDLVSGIQTPIANYAAASIIDVSGVTNSYLMSGRDNTGYWSGYNIRDNHPYAWSGGGSVVGSGGLSGPTATGNGIYTLTFDLGNGVWVGNTATIGFAVSCGNDVLRERVSAPVPEPSGALLFALGAFVVARRQRRVRAASS